MPSVLSVLALAGLAAGEVYFEDTFDSGIDGWTPGKSPGKDMGKWVHTAGKWFADEAADKGMATSEDMRHHAISAPLKTPASSKGKDLVVQFSAKIEDHQYSFCGGGYIKLMPKDFKPETFGGDDQYNIMFGPDLCGYDVSHIHLIFNHKGENLLKTDKISLEYADKNEFTHLYTAHIKPDGTYEVFFDLESKATGKLIDGWAFPQKEIDDPKDEKPSDWVDDEEMDDPEDKKPDGYDDIPEQIPDPEASKPEDWDDEDDGEWEAPLIDNPEFKGPWSAKRIPNPAYKGVWAPKQIPNPSYEEGVQLAAYESFHVGYELWTVNNGTIFDNILVTDDIEYAKAQGEKLWRATSKGEKDAKEKWDKENKPAEEEASDEDMGEDEEEEEEEKDEL